MLLFSNLNEDNIKTLWKKPGEIDIVDYTHIEYSYDLPLYVKFIIRYQTTSRRAAASLYNQLSPGYRNMLLNWYRLYGLEYIVDFFVWIENSLGSYDISRLEGVFDNSDDSNYVKEWRENSIQFFFSLNKETQMSLILRYYEDIQRCDDLKSKIEENRLYE